MGTKTAVVRMRYRRLMLQHVTRLTLCTSADEFALLNSVTNKSRAASAEVTP